MVGLVGLSTAGFLGWQVIEELYNQAKLHPLIDEAVRLCESDRRIRQALGPPPYTVHSFARVLSDSIHATKDHKKALKYTQTEAWLRGPIGSGKMTIVGESNDRLRHVSVQLRISGKPIVVYDASANNAKRRSIINYLAEKLLRSSYRHEKHE